MFNYSQVYVALSLATSLHGLHILGTLQSKHIQTNPKVHEEHERLRVTWSLHSHITTDLCNNEIVSICLLNIRSIKKHSLDLSNDPNLSKCDVLAITETQFLPSIPNDHINSILNNFSVHRQDHNSDKFLSLAVCYQDAITLCDAEYFPSINGLKFLVKCARNTLSCLLLYRKNGGNIQQLIACLEYIITSLDIDVIFEDFNIDYFNEKNISLLKVLASL